MFRFHLIVSFYFAVFQVDLRIFMCPHICSIESFTFDHQVCNFWGTELKIDSSMNSIFCISTPHFSPHVSPHVSPHFPIIPSISPHFPYIFLSFSLQFPWFSLHFPWFSHGKVAWPAVTPSLQSWIDLGCSLGPVPGGTAMNSVENASDGIVIMGL